jgi:hypothetical protein
MSRINEKQREEWTENPVTIELLRLVNKELIEIVSTPTASCLSYGDPYKSHEELVRLDARAHTFATIQLALEGDWGYFEELEDE